MLYLMLAVTIIFFLFSYITLGHDVFQPSCLVSASYIVSILSAYINQDIWDYTYHIETIEVIALGLSVFYLANLMAYMTKGRVCTGSHSITEMKPLYINDIIYVLIILLQSIALLLYLREVVSISGGGINFGKMMNSFRMATYSSEMGVSTLASQLYKFSFICAQIFLLVFLNNAIYRNVKNNILNLFPVIIYSINVLISASRFNILVLMIEALILYNILWHKKNGWKRSFKFKTILKMLILVCVFFMGFYWVRTLVGRENDSDLITYITSYSGGSIPLFDMFLQNPPSDGSELWGAETFYGLLGDLKSLRIINFTDYSSHLEFRSSNGVLIGNVYTAFRREINDFGLFGMIILQFICSAIFSGAYSRKQYFSNFGMLIYAMSAYPLFLHSINDSFYMSIVSIGTVYTFVLSYMFYNFIIRFSIRDGKIVIHKKKTGMSLDNNVR